MTNVFKYILCFGSTPEKYTLLEHIYHLKRFAYNDFLIFLPSKNSNFKLPCFILFNSLFITL